MTGMPFMELAGESVRAARSAPAAAPEVRISEGFLLRIGGLAFSRSEQLKNPGLVAAIATSLACESAIAAAVEQLSKDLYDAISAANGHPALQNTLLSVRRKVFNGRPVSRNHVDFLDQHLAGPVCAALAEWSALREQLDHHTLAAHAALQQWQAAQRQELKRLACEPDFRKGLLISSPSFERTLDDYVRCDGLKMNRKLRLTERTLLLYLFRTSHKTSPFSTLTPVCFGRFDSAAPGGLAPQLTGWDMRSAAKPNIAILARVAQALTLNATHYPHLRVALKDGWSVKGKRITFLKRKETAVNISGPVHSAVSEFAFAVHLTPSLQIILDMLATGDAAIADMQAALMSGLGMAPEKALQYIHVLIDSGLLLISGLRPSAFDPDCWAHFAARLEQMRDPALLAAAYGLRSIDLKVQQYAQATPAARRSILSALDGEVAQVLELVGNTASVPHPTLYEDATISKAPVLLDKMAWQAPLAQLAEMHCFLSLFDPLLVSKITFKTLFKKRFGVGGECRDIQAFSDFFHEAFYRTVSASNRRTDIGPAFGGGILNALRIPEIVAIQEAQQHFLSVMADVRPDAAENGDIMIPPELVEQIGRLALGRHKRLSNSFFFQLATENDTPRLVLNHVYAGHGYAFSRFAHLFDDGAQQPVDDAQRKTLKASEPAGSLFAEFQGGHDTNLNQHRLVADVELVLPGERGVAAPACQIRLCELTLRHDGATDDIYLYCERLDKRIIPVYLGMFYPLALPELQTLLLHLSAPVVLRSDLFPKPLPDDGSVLYRPRIRYRQIIIERARWTAPASKVPRREPLEEDYPWMVRLAKWRIGAGIPAQAFVKIEGGGANAADRNADRKADDSSQDIGGNDFGQKPFYLDFENQFCVSLFEKHISGIQGYLHFTEMLPTREGAIHCDGHAHVSEFVVEITQSERR
ncbi:lantibiotic dehydratase [Massilia antarctica]|uniref:lantibiotic dehydratase n=1 Tax=Massilia antarctica TaxID=2765360 RepID=UPI0006BB90DA|nr:lantibiotic dehydratase [Massilia sp. H27-R4]MCY0914519.1 lantibiotic dehydratase [Massilia sp. H27-R4]CUI03089.1 Lanthionine biosynthesis protein LanB [Janthinobacterium sp. CG23_2]CUU26875.1 Lanthionine biosynthesis protein LanB [Janthinobacterium sp. CG23_2]